MSVGHKTRKEAENISLCENWESHAGLCESATCPCGDEAWTTDWVALVTAWWADRGKRLLPFAWLPRGYICVHCPKVGSVLSCVEQDSDNPEQRQRSLAEGIEEVHGGAEAAGLVQPAQGKSQENWNAVLCPREKEGQARLFPSIHCKRIRPQQWQVAAGNLSIWQKKAFFMGTSVKHCPRNYSWFPRKAVESPCMEMFKAQLLKLSNLRWASLI